MRTGPALLLSAVILAISTIGAARLARTPSELAHVLAAVLVAGGIVAVAALTPTHNYSRRALLGAGAILAACTALPLVLVEHPETWLRQNPMVLSNFWIWMMVVGIPYPKARSWCMSARAFLVAAAILGGASVVATLW